MAIKILIVTHSASLYTGLAEITRTIFTELLRRFPAKYMLHQVALFEPKVPVCCSPWPSTPTAEAIGIDADRGLSETDIAGQKSVVNLLRIEHYDIVFGFNDPQNLMHLVRPEILCQTKVILYVPFDGVPVPSEFLQLTRADVVVAMSEFSRSAFCNLLADERRRIDVIYGSVDPSRFTPRTRDEAAAMRRELFPSWIPDDAFVLGWVGRNQWRKQSWIALAIIALLRSGRYLVCEGCGRAYPQSLPSSEGCVCRSRRFELAKPLTNIYLWMHLPTGKRGGQWPMRLLEEMYGAWEGEAVHYTQECDLHSQLTPEAMANLYALFDVFLSLSGGEGFGVPTMEAMACGIPIVYSDYSGNGELARRANAGVAVSGILQPEADNCILRFISNEYSALTAIRKLYFDPILRASCSRNGRDFALLHRPEIIVDKWNSVFSDTANSPRSESKVTES